MRVKQSGVGVRPSDAGVRGSEAGLRGSDVRGSDVGVRGSKRDSRENRGGLDSVQDVVVPGPNPDLQTRLCA